MAGERPEQSAQEALAAYVAASTEASGVPVLVTDRAVLLDVARWLDGTGDD